MKFVGSALALFLPCFALQAAHADCSRLFVSPEDEVNAIAASQGMAARSGIRLDLQTDGGKISLEDRDCEEDAQSCIGHVFAGLSPNGNYYVLQLQYYEDRTAALVDKRDGTITYLAGLPDWSPDGSRFYSAYYDSHYSGVFFEIVNVTDRPYREYFLQPKEPVTYCVDHWLDSEEIALKKTIWAAVPAMEFGPEFSEAVLDARLKRVQGEWVLLPTD